MWQKITVWLWIVIVGGLVTELVADTVVSDENATKIIKENPIIIDTVLTHYGNPTIDEYYRCIKDRDKCLENCKFMDRECQNKCPTCPVLYNHDVLVQGINDTEYRAPVTTDPANQTNIIRLTNQIQNIIDTKLGNMSSNNQNIINVYQNKSSKIGGKFGLGYTERGPCCHVIEPKRCKRSVRGFTCIPRRQRTCGPHCISRVMRAKRVVSCNEKHPEDCISMREYIPQHRRPGCQYTSKYPFINCGTYANHMPRVTSCNKCLMIPYRNVIRGQVPRDCLRCYGYSQIHPPKQFHPLTYSYHNRPSYSSYPSFYEPYIPPSAYDYNFEDDYSSTEDDFNEQNIPTISNGQESSKEKCNNTSEEDCEGNGNNNEDEMEINKAISRNDDKDYENGDDYYDDPENNSD